MDDEPQAIEEQAPKPPAIQDQPAYQPDMATRQREWDLQARRAAQDRLRGLCLAHPDVAELVRQRDSNSALIVALNSEVARLKLKCGEVEQTPAADPAPNPTAEAMASAEETVQDSAEGGGDFEIPGHGKRRNRRT